MDMRLHTSRVSDVLVTLAYASRLIICRPDELLMTSQKKQAMPQTIDRVSSPLPRPCRSIAVRLGKSPLKYMATQGTPQPGHRMKHRIRYVS